jgi:hypothetical protein
MPGPEPGRATPTGASGLADSARVIRSKRGDTRRRQRASLDGLGHGARIDARGSGYGHAMVNGCLANGSDDAD